MPSKLNQFLEQAVHEIPAGVIITDTGGKIFYVNRMACELSGYSFEEMLGQYPSALLHGPDTNQATTAYIRQNILARQALKVEILNYTKSKHAYWVELRIQPIYDETKALIGFIAIQVDISARKASESELLSERVRICENEKRLYQVLDLTQEGVWDWDLTTNVIIHNRQWFRILGIDSSTLYGHSDMVFEYIHPDDREMVRVALEEHFSGKSDVYDIEHRMIRVNGSVIWVRCRGKVLAHDEQGNPLRILGSTLDITKQIESEKEKIKQQNLLRLVIDELPDFLVVKDAQANFSLCNKPVAEFYGTTPEEMVGKDDGAFGVPPDMNEFFRQNVLGIMARGETEIVFEQSQDALTGDVHHFKSIKKPFKDEEGNDYILVIPHDISDIVRAQEQVQESEKRLSYVLDISQEGIWDWDIPSGIVTHNMQWFLMLGVMPLNLRGGIESFKKYLYPEDAEMVFSRIEAHLRGETDTYESEHRMVDDGGNIIWVRDRGRVVERDEQGSPIRMLGSFSNISKRKIAEEGLIAAKQEAEFASKAKSQFLAAMSHEIRTPMNGVIGMTSMLLTTELNAEQKDYIETIRSSGEALLTVINDILDFSKVEAGAMKLESAEFNIRQVAKDTLEIFTPQVKTKGLTLQLDIAEDFTSIVVGDAGRWRQILTNFVGNAVKFTTSGGVKARLSSRMRDDKHIEIKTEVIDTGIGIAADELSLLFRPFQQTSSGHGRKFGGTGLGLSISRQFAKLMGGDTGVESQVGHGSNFWFTVVLEIGNQDRQQTHTKSVIEQTLSPKHLLLVEDNMVNQKVAQAMIKRLGHQVDSVSNGEEAVKILQMVNYDLVLMDCQMPIMDGYQATRAIRSGELGQVLNANIPIVALTANVVQEDRDACFAAGMDDFLSKPFDIQSLVAVLAKWLPEPDEAS